MEKFWQELTLLKSVNISPYSYKNVFNIILLCLDYSIISKRDDATII